ncbi:hypothetical protein [Phycobacter sp. K97]|uniref:hypothetical protein n=1 Tax=Phycobacter sedimenti TaxID=3133977 RepID=UPI00311F7714
MFHDPSLFLDQAPAAPAHPVSRIRCPRSAPKSSWPTPGVMGEQMQLIFGPSPSDIMGSNTPEGNKTLH